MNTPRRGRSGKQQPGKQAHTSRGQASRSSGRGGRGGKRQGGGGQRRGQGAGRTGPLGEKRAAGRGLGGEQLEGRQAVRELLLAQRRKVYEVQISSELEHSEVVEDIVTIAAAERVPVRYVARKKLEAAAISEAPQGVIAHAAPLREYPLHDLLSKKGRLFLVALDGITDPGNLGAIIRNCDGAGVDGIIVPRHRAVHVTPTVAKASAGAIEYAKIAVVSGLPSALAELGKHEVWRIGLDDAAAVSIFEVDPPSLFDRCCVVLGAEGAGLSRLTRQRCDLMANIPMHGAVSSLNVSAAAAITTYEVARSRGE